jgi:hypothetical protein
MDPFVKAYLEAHSFQELEDEHGVCARWNATHDKVCLNYDQILTKSGDKLAEQCRGMVVRPTSFTYGDDWKHKTVGNVSVLAWPMNRFYNAGDSAAAEIDWSDPRLKVYEKLDGTCIILYWDPLHGKWHAGTRGVPEADLPIRGDDLNLGDTTFSQLFWKAYYQTSIEVAQRKEFEEQPPQSLEKFIAYRNMTLDKDITYVWELTSPHNQIVVYYDKPRVTLLAMRNVKTGVELDVNLHAQAHMEVPAHWDIKDEVSLATFVDSADPGKLEGAVVCVPHGPFFARQKVKNKAWVLSSRAKDTVTASPRSALECIILGKIDDVIPLVPKAVGDKLLRMQWAYGQYCKEIDKRIAEFTLEAAGNRKRYAEQVMLAGDFNAPYFHVWEGKSESAHTWFMTACHAGKLSAASLDTILKKLAL